MNDGLTVGSLGEADWPKVKISAVVHPEYSHSDTNPIFIANCITNANWMNSHARSQDTILTCICVWLKMAPLLESFTNEKVDLLTIIMECSQSIKIRCCRYSKRPYAIDPIQDDLKFFTALCYHKIHVITKITQWVLSKILSYQYNVV